MNSSYLLSIITWVYGLAAVLYISSWIFKKPRVAKAAFWITVLAVIGNSAGFILRWVESYQMGIGHIPLSNMYESLVFFSFTIGVIYLFVEIRYKNPVVGVFATPMAFLAIAYASLSPNISDKIRPLLPALKSNWLTAHVFVSFLGYAALAIAFGISLMYLLKSLSQKESKGLLSYLPDLKTLTEMTYRMILFGFIFLTACIITGAVWANSAWGSYWTWDPKETWSLITWLIYGIWLHLRISGWWSDKRLAWVSVLGFLAVLFTYFGVNYLPGLHSYGAQ